MMNALYANTLGNAFFSCQKTAEIAYGPCPRDASRDQFAVVMACTVDAACAAKAQRATGDTGDGSPVQAQANLDASGW